MATDPPEAATPTAPEGVDREGRIRVAISIGATVALLASYFTPWWHGDYPPPDNTPYIPVTAIFDPRQGVHLYAVIGLIGLPLLATLFAFLTLHGSHEARRLFANFGLMTSCFLAFQMLATWWSGYRRVIDAGGVVGVLANLLIIGVALSLSIALPGTSSGRQGAP